MKNILIDWRGIEPSLETKNKMESILNTLGYILPPDSDIRINIEMFHKNFEAHIVVRSPLGDFVAQSKHKDLFSLCKNLRKNLKQQIFKSRESHQSWSRAS
jgi:ribosome-associated translation inhibitor RaiA